MPLISVVIPCHNYGRYLGEAIESALGQGGDVEVVVVDDGSTDHTPAVAHSYPSVRYVRQENRGLAAARNRGLAESSGSLVVFLDADDRLRERALETLYRRLQERPDCAFSYGHHEFVDAGGSPMSTTPQPCVEHDIYRAMLRAENHPIHNPGVVMYRRSALEEVGGFDTDPRIRCCEDLELNLRLVRDHRACCSDRVVLDYRLHGANMISNPARMLMSSLAVQRAQHAYVKANQRYRPDYVVGIRTARRYFGRRLARQIWRQATSGRLRSAAAGFSVLMRHYPPGVLVLASRALRASAIAGHRRLRGRSA